MSAYIARRLHIRKQIYTYHIFPYKPFPDFISWLRDKIYNGCTAVRNCLGSLVYAPVFIEHAGAWLCEFFRTHFNSANDN